MRSRLAVESSIVVVLGAILGAAGLRWVFRALRGDSNGRGPTPQPLIDPATDRFLGTTPLAPMASMATRQDNRDQFAKLRHERDEALIKVDQVTSESNLLRGRITSLRAEIERLEVETKRLTEAAAQAEGLEAERERLGNELAALEAKARATEEHRLAEEDDHQARLLMVTSQVDELRRTLGDDQARIDALENDLTRGREEFALLAAKLADAEQAHRAAGLSHQQELAALRQQLGQARAAAERVEPLLRLVEDRESVIRSIALERDNALTALAKREAELREEMAIGRSELRRLQALDTENARLKERLENVERQMSKVARERDDLAASEKRIKIEIEGFRSEIKERDVRFRALLADRRHLVEAGRTEAARLRELVAVLQSELARTVEKRNQPKNGSGSDAPRRGDDLTRISGIGIFTAELLRRNGITTFRQIAGWTDGEIDQFAGQLKGLGHRIRRERWSEQARREHERAHGESLDAKERGH